MDKKSNDADIIPDIKPETDEVMSYRRNARKEPAKQSNFNGLLVFVLVFMAIFMAASGYALYELQLQLKVSNDLLQKAGEERTRLEEDMAVSGVKSSSAFKKMNDQQQANISEIRKLWVIAYEQNKLAIERLAKSVQKLETLNKHLGNSNTKLTARVDALNSQFSALSSDLTEVNTQVSIVRNQMQDQSDVVEKNNRALSSLKQKIKGLEEDIGTFDRYRLQTNKKLLDLQKQIKIIPPPAPASPPPPASTSGSLIHPSAPPKTQ